MKVIATAVAAAALAATALVGAPVSAAPAPEGAPTPRALERQEFTVFAKFTSRQVVRYGGANDVGDLTVTQGTVSDTSGGNIGTLTTVMRVVAPSPKKDAELRDTQSQIQLKNGQIFAQAVNEDPKGKPPVDLHIMPVTGGTGAYASARGTLLMRKVGDKYLFAYDIFVEKKLSTTTFAFGTPVRQTITGKGTQGIGTVTLARAAAEDRSYVSIATRAGSKSGTVTDSIDLEVFTADGSLFGRTIARSKSGAAKAQVFAVLGGTGTYAGYRGEMTLSANGRSITARLAAPGGKSKPITWFEDNGRGVSQLAITGGTLLGVQGRMFKDAGGTKKDGDYFATRIEYAEIDGVTPVVTMLEQVFSTGTMIVSGISLSAGTDGKAVFRPIVGGTGDFGGASGQVSSLQESSKVWRKSGRFWR